MEMEGLYIDGWGGGIWDGVLGGEGNDTWYVEM